MWVYLLFDIPDFIEFVQSHDVVALAETKLLAYDNINIEGYTVFPKASYIVEGNKKKRHIYGGVCLLVKNDFVHLCQEVTLNSTIKHYDGILWCIIGKIILGVVYIPPCRSANLDDEIFERLQNDIVDIDSECDFDDICLLGDFNGRTGTKFKLAVQYLLIMDSQLEFLN